MADLAAVLQACLGLFQIKFTLDGFTFSFWQLFLFLLVAGAVIALIIHWIGD